MGSSLPPLHWNHPPSRLQPLDILCGRETEYSLLGSGYSSFLFWRWLVSRSLNLSRRLNLKLNHYISNSILLWFQINWTSNSIYNILTKLKWQQIFFLTNRRVSWRFSFHASPFFPPKPVPCREHWRRRWWRSRGLRLWKRKSASWIKYIESPLWGKHGLVYVAVFDRKPNHIESKLKDQSNWSKFN